MRLALASQRLEDFGGALAELANRYWILGAGGKASEAETLAAMFALGDTLSEAIRYRLTGPGRDGAPALLIASGAGGRFEQLVVNEKDGDGSSAGRRSGARMVTAWRFLAIVPQYLVVAV